MTAVKYEFLPTSGLHQYCIQVFPDAKIHIYNNLFFILLLSN